MGVVVLDQRSQQWHDWRAGKDLPDGKSRITGTMLPIIRGESPYKTRHRLWEELTGRKEPPKQNFAMMRGVQFEDAARMAYIKKTGRHMDPVCFEHDDHPEFGVSLDGFELLGNRGVEIKCAGAKDFAMALSGRVPDKYWTQVQWQLFCSAAECFDYWSYNIETGEGALVTVYPDLRLFEEMKAQALEFRQCLIDDKEPAGDVWMAEARLYRIAESEFSSAKDALDEAKNSLLSSIPDGQESISGGGVNASLVPGRKGSIDTDKLVADLVGLGLITQEKVEEYRKPSGKPSWRVTVSKDEALPEDGGKRSVPATTAVASETWDF